MMESGSETWHINQTLSNDKCIVFGIMKIELILIILRYYEKSDTKSDTK